MEVNFSFGSRQTEKDKEKEQEEEQEGEQTAEMKETKASSGSFPAQHHNYTV